MAIVSGLILLGIGLITCFFGWRFFRFIIGLQGFVVGYALAHVILAPSDSPGLLPTLGNVGAFVIAIIVGLVLFFIFYQFLYRFAFIVIGAVLGLMIAGLIITAFNMSEAIAAVVAIVLVIIGAIIGNTLSDTIIRLGTAFSGASQSIGGLAALATAVGIALPLADPTAGSLNTQSTAGIITLIAVILLGVIGFMFQTQDESRSE